MTFEQDARSIAAAIGRKLCEEAVWSGDMCRWLDATTQDPDTAPLPSSESWLGGNLYSGSAGIALFLSQLSSPESEVRFSETARGALQHAVACKKTIGAQPNFGAFAGTAGLLYALHHMRGQLPRDTVENLSAELIEDMRAAIRSPKGPFYLDIILGAAGAILVLLALHAEKPREEIAELAFQLGEEICARADWSDNWCTWDNSDALDADTLPLAGLSHGASGMALSLMKLFALTGEKDFLFTARGAYAYEDSLFEPSLANWLDVRFIDSVEQARSSRKEVAVWCHGAPGIALSRMVAAKIDTEQSEKYRSDVRVALGTTATALQQALNTPGYDASPCHGIAGLAGVLDIAGGETGNGDLQETARLSMMKLISRYGTKLDFPSGMPDGGYSPSLMLGIAGIGYTMLSMANPASKGSVLLLS